MVDDSLNEPKTSSSFVGSTPLCVFKGSNIQLRLLSILIVFALLVSAMFVIGLSEESDAEPDHSGPCGDGVTYTYTSSTKTLAIDKTGGGTGAMTGYSPGEAPWYSYRNDIQTLTIGNGVTSIGNYAFYECSGFTGSLTIPNSVTSIGNFAFYGCLGFTGSLTISNSVTSIGNFAFYLCSEFTGALTIPNSVTSIGYSAF